MDEKKTPVVSIDFISAAGVASFRRLPALRIIGYAVGQTSLFSLRLESPESLVMARSGVSMVEVALADCTCVVGERQRMPAQSVAMFVSPPWTSRERLGLANRPRHIGRLESAKKETA